MNIMVIEPRDFNNITNIVDDNNDEITVTDDRLLFKDNDNNKTEECVKESYKKDTLSMAKENNTTKISINKERNVNRHRRRLTSRANTLYLLLRMSTEYNMMLKQWLLCLLLCSVSGYREQKFAMEPQDQSAVVGSRVILPCRVEGKSGQLQWTKDDFGLGTHRHLNGYERYRMIGSDEEGDYSLDIREVTLDDDALYQCQVSSGPHGEVPIRSRYARLIVLMPPERPKITQGAILNAVEDREVNLECVSVGGRPAAEITWVDNDGGVLTQGVNYTVEPMPDGRRFTARSILRLRPRRLHHNQTFTCQAQNTADRAYRAVTIKLQVQYAPKVRMFVKTGILKNRIQEGDTVVIGCQANANPNNLTYKWFVNNEQLFGDIRNELVLSNVSRKYNEATVKCEAHNTVGRSADTKTLEVAYGPSFSVKPENVEAERGATATLTCVVDGYPAPKITWLRYENERFIRVGKSSELTVSVTPQSAGQYWCRGSIDGRPDVEAPAIIYIRGPPKITSNQTQYGVEGDSVRIECVSFSVPKPDYVLWTYKGSEINSFHNQEYAFLEETLADRMTKSTLIVRRSEAKHFGPYNCTVINSFGMDSVEITLLPDKSLPLVLIISALASVITSILIVMLIIMLCHRKTSKELKKPDLTEKTCVDFKDSDRHSNISDLKLELRQVEGNCDIDNSNGGSETDLHPTLHLTSNLGLPLAGPVPLPDSGYDNELMKQYQRYSGDFNQAINHLNFKGQAQTNGYVPYVDYSRDYAPPSVPSDSLSGSLSRSIDGSYPSQGSLRRQASSGRLGGLIGPDVIPMTNPGVIITGGGVDVRYAATYGNPYLRGSGPLSYVSQNTNPPAKHAPPPYYTVRNTTHTSSGPSISPASSSSSKPVTSPLASSSSTKSGAQPQVPKASPQSSGALYILPPSSQGSLQSQKILKDDGTHENVAVQSAGSDPPVEVPADTQIDASLLDVVDTSKEDLVITEELDSEVLTALGASTSECPEYGEKIHENLAQLWLPLLKKGLSKEDKERLLKDHLVPQNCNLLQAPKLNPEISAAVAESTRNRDKKLVGSQQQLGAGVTAINRAMDMLLSKEFDKLRVIKHLSDACRILSDLHYRESQTRIKLITPSLDKSFLNIIQDTCRDETLFGIKLSEKIKASKTIEKQGLQIKKSFISSTAPSTSAAPRPPQTRGNWGAPPRYPSNRGGRGGIRKPAPASTRKPPATPPAQAKYSTKPQARS